MKIAIHDWNREMPVVLVNNNKEAKLLNEDGYAIYKTVNTFKEKRRETHLVKLDAFYVEFDDGDKLSQMQKLARFLIPSKIIESKAGYHCYWNIEDDLVKEYGKEKSIVIYKEILKRLVHHLGADLAVKDVTRVLRVPNFLHNKNPNEPFMIKKVYESSYTYLAHQFLSLLKPLKIKQVVKHINKTTMADGTFWDKADSLDVVNGLRRISGIEELGGELIEVKSNQVWVNGKSTANWIDENGRIGSHGGGGPNLGTWIKWYTGCWSETKKILCKYFPEISES